MVKKIGLFFTGFFGGLIAEALLGPSPKVIDYFEALITVGIGIPLIEKYIGKKDWKTARTNGLYFAPGMIFGITATKCIEKFLI